VAADFKTQAKKSNTCFLMLKDELTIPFKLFNTKDKIFFSPCLFSGNSMRGRACSRLHSNLVWMNNLTAPSADLATSPPAWSSTLRRQFLHLTTLSKEPGS